MFHPVSIPNASFVFCRYSVALILWISFITKNPIFVIIAMFIFIFSSIFSVKYSPMIWIYSLTFEKFFPSKYILLDIKAMRFIHFLAAFFTLLILLVYYFINISLAWKLLFLFSILKSITALGYCPADRLYKCLNSNGSCCAFLKKQTKQQ